MENPRRYRTIPPWFHPKLEDDSVSETLSGMDIFSAGHRKVHYTPQVGLNSLEWEDDPTLKPGPQRRAAIQPAPCRRTNTFLERLFRVPYAGAWMIGIAFFAFTVAICFALIGILPPSLFLSESSHHLASQLCNIPLVRMLPLCPSSGIPYEHFPGGISNETARWPTTGRDRTSTSSNDFSKSALYRAIASTQALFKKRLGGRGAPGPMTMKLQLGLYLVKESKVHLSVSKVPSRYEMLEAYSALTTDLDRSIDCFQKFTSEINRLFDLLGLGLPHLSRELAQLEARSNRRPFWIRPFFGFSDKARLLTVYTSRMKSFEKQTMDLLIKGNACFIQLPSLEADWSVINHLNINSSQTLQNTLDSLRGPFEAFLPTWFTLNPQVREVHRMLELLNTLSVVHVTMWSEVASVAQDVEEVEHEIAAFQERLRLETFELDGGSAARSHLILAIIDARNAEAEMKKRGLRDWVSLERLWEKGRGKRELMDPLWLGDERMGMLEEEDPEEGKGGRIREED